MSLGLSHSLSRYKLKFSPDKVGCQDAVSVSLPFHLHQRLCQLPPGDLMN